MTTKNSIKAFEMTAAQTKPHVTAETKRDHEELKAEYRMFGSLLFIFGLCSAYASLAGLTNFSGAPIINAVKIVVFIDGLVLSAIGYCATVLDMGSTRICSIAVALSLLTLIQFIARFVETLQHAFLAGMENIYIPHDYHPSKFDIQYIALMSFISYASLAVGYVGSLGVVSCSMFNIQVGKFQNYSSIHFRRNASILNTAFILYGFSHLSLGSFLLFRYGSGLLPDGPITNAGIFKVICFPEISIAVGALQMATGTVGLARSLRSLSGDNDVKSIRSRAVLFQILCLLSYIAIVSLQVLTQIAFAPNHMGSQYAVSLVCNHVGFLITMAFLDWKIKTALSETGYLG